MRDHHRGPAARGHPGLRVGARDAARAERHAGAAGDSRLGARAADERPAATARPGDTQDAWTAARPTDPGSVLASDRYGSRGTAARHAPWPAGRGVDLDFVRGLGWGKSSRPDPGPTRASRSPGDPGSRRL